MTVLSQPCLPSERPDSGIARECYEVVDGSIIREVRLGDRRHRSILCPAPPAWTGSLDSSNAESAYLRSKSSTADIVSTSAIRCVDLFSGCGGLSLGVREAARATGRSFAPVLACDFEEDALGVYAKNFPGGKTTSSDITHLFDSAVGEALSASERRLRRDAGPVDLLVGGPPCQGHSDLNNHTRRLDPKNELYFTMVRAAEVLEPSWIMIENVPGAVRDRRRVVQRTAEALVTLGYEVDFGVVDMSKIGVPQKRRRLMMVAARSLRWKVSEIERRWSTPLRTVKWAMGDLEGRTSNEPFDQVANSAPLTRERIRFLFENRLFELPDSQRPACHRDKAHTYGSIYGRLRWDEPSQTITTGFYSMCMGRYVHPSEQRTLTAHEAARLQYFPDAFDFSTATGRNSLAQMIGNAVPSRLSYVAAMELLGC